MFFSSSYRITYFHDIYKIATFSEAWVFKLYLESHCVTVHVWFSNLKCNLSLLDLRTESVGYTTPIGAPPYVEPMFVSSTFKITRLHFTYGCATLSGAFVCKLYLKNHWVTLGL